jgi:lipoprotein-releasing system ATP-binding protein
MLVQLEQVSKSYFNESGTNERVILDKLDLTIDRGERIAIVGPSGSGKTTLLNLIGTLDAPDSGKILLNGRDLSACSDKELASLRRTGIGFVFQLHHLLPQLTLAENILLPTLSERKLQGEETTGRLKKLVTRLGLEGLEQQRPSELSGGECQRTAVARALINRPELVLADEPTGALDHRTALNLVRLLVELSKEEKMALIVVTHSPEIAAEMDTVYRMEEGKLIRTSHTA